jgi:hypothetical protein
MKMTSEEQEAALTLWANGVAEELDEKARPELAQVFRALARRDADAVRDAVSLFPPHMLSALREMVELEYEDRYAAGEDRSAEILAWLIDLVAEAQDRHATVDIDPSEAGPIQ